MGDRRSDLDAAKGLGMLLVIIGHTHPPETLVMLIYGLHMPLFFFVSGLLWRGQVDMKRSIRALGVPFVIASLVSWGLWLMKQRAHASGDVPWWGPLLATLWGGDINGYLVHNTPLWFLPAMLSMLLVLYLLAKANVGRHAPAILAVIGIALIFAPTGLVSSGLPMSIGQGVVGGVFFAAGYWTKLYFRLPTPIFAALALVAAFSLSLLNGQVDLFSLYFQQPLLYLAAGVIGSWSLVGLCSLSIAQAPVITFIGRHSLFIMAIHMPLLWVLRGALRAAHLPEFWWLLAFSCSALMVGLSLCWDRWTNNA